MPKARLCRSRILGLLVGVQLLLVVTLVLSLLALCTGTYPKSLQNSAILNFDTSSIRNGSASPTSTPDSGSLTIQDWYEAHYLSICSGMWDSTDASKKNSSTTSCIRKSAGYTFSLAQILAPSNASGLLETGHPSYGIIDTKTPFILLVLGITFTSLPLGSFFFSVVTIMARGITKSPMQLLREAFIAIIGGMLFLTISSAKITAIADNAGGTVELGGFGTVTTTRGTEFYAFVWLGTALMWCAMILQTFGAFNWVSWMEREKREYQKARELDVVS